ncbi:unnamed protein product [Chironomus riparius]|uniref:CLIP domain-containing serine protease n=1 Tax=Chironomus riparius TaxID=315576 RepID=A0A9N9RWT9_9DIPT|nr:unnamed protein product [Chironomus riparius]
MISLFAPSIKMLLLLVFFANFIAIGSLQTAKCYTPDQYPGVCVELKQCEPLYKIRYKVPQTKEDRIFLSLSLCGFRHKQPIVCCSSLKYVNPKNNLIQGKEFIVPQNSLPEPAECSAAHEERIFGGDEAKVDEFPFSALLLYTKVVSDSSAQPEYSYNCGGSLISHNVVLTAAHCVSASILRTSLRNYELRGVRLGEYNLKTNPDCGEGVTEDYICAPKVLDVGIDQQIVHELFNRDKHYDIALLKLSQRVEYSNFIKPICLPFDDIFRNTDNLNFIVTGFGRTEVSDFSDIKLKTNVGAVRNDECEKLLITQDSSKTILSSQLCALGIDTQDSCNGDSGNGLIYVNTRSTHAHWVILGVTSYGPSPCGSEIPGVYTRVSEFIPWIMGKL